MTVVFFTLCSVLLHLAVFVCYPHTGKMGFLFLLFSCLLWCACFIFIATMLPSFKRSTILFLDTAALLASLLSTLFFIPQQDGGSVFDKVSLGIYPTRATVYMGLRRLGIDYSPLKPPEKPPDLIEL